MLGDSRDGVLFPRSSCHKKIKGNDFTKMTGLTYLMQVKKAIAPRTDGDQGNCRCPSDWGTLISLLVPRAVCLFNSN